MEELIALLTGMSILRHLSDEEGSRLAGLAVERNIVKGEYLAHYGEIRPCILSISN